MKKDVAIQEKRGATKKTCQNAFTEVNGGVMPTSAKRKGSRKGRRNGALPVVICDREKVSSGGEPIVPSELEAGG